MNSQLFESRCQEVRAAAAPAGCDRCDRDCAHTPLREYRRDAKGQTWIEHCSECGLYRQDSHEASTLFQLRNLVRGNVRSLRRLDSNRRLIRECQSQPIEPVATVPDPVAVVLQDDHECLIVEYARP